MTVSETRHPMTPQKAQIENTSLPEFKGYRIFEDPTPYHAQLSYSELLKQSEIFKVGIF